MRGGGSASVRATDALRQGEWVRGEEAPDARPRGEVVPQGLYCLRGPTGEWEPSVLGILSSKLSADIDFTSGRGEIIAAGHWRPDEYGIEIVDAMRGPAGRLTKRRRLFDIGQQNGRAVLVESTTSRPRSAGASYVFVSEDPSIEVYAGDGRVERRSLSSLISAFHSETRLLPRRAQRAHPPESAVPAAESGPRPQVTAQPEPTPTVPVSRPRPPSSTVSPYATNAFRVLGLPTTADARDVSRRARELAMVAALDGDDDGARRIKEAERALADTVRRSADALLWLGGLVGAISPDLDLSDSRAVSRALSALQPRAQAGDDGALHDLAVIAHAAALEDASVPIERWRTGLEAWGTLVSRDRFWKAERLRAELDSDVRLRAETIDELRASLPWRLLEPSARVIASLIEAGRDDDALTRLGAIAESGLPRDDIARARGLATAHLRSAIAQAERTVTEAVDTFDRDKNGDRLFRAAQAVAADVPSTLRRVARLDPGGPDTAVRIDALAEALRLASVRLHNEADSTSQAVVLVEQAAEIVASSSVRSRLLTDARVLRRLGLRQQANAAAGREDWDGAARDLQAALQFADDTAERADIEQSIVTCRMNAAMKRAVRAAEARNWTAAIAAAEEARPYVRSVQDRANLDAFIVRCRQARPPSLVAQGVQKIVGLVITMVVLAVLGSVCSSISSIGRGSTSSASARPPVVAQAPVSKPASATTAAPMTTPVALPNGQHIQPAIRTSGRSWLDVVNGTSRDAVVKLVDGTNTAVRFVYVVANNRARLEGIEPGSYRVRFASGQDWDSAGRRFRRDPAFTEFRDPFDFTVTNLGTMIQYTTGEITLNPVRGGNAPSNSIDEGRF